jgi:hypothetical protein
MQEVGPEELTLLPGSEGGVAAPSVSRGPRAEGRAAAAEGDVEPIDGAEGDGGGGARGEAEQQGMAEVSRPAAAELEQGSGSNPSRPKLIQGEVTSLSRHERTKPVSRHGATASSAQSCQTVSPGCAWAHENSDFGAAFSAYTRIHAALPRLGVRDCFRDAFGHERRVMLSLRA